MAEDQSEPSPTPHLSEPDPPDLPQYVIDAVQRQGPTRLGTIADYATALAEYKRAKQEIDAELAEETEAVSEDELRDVECSTDPADYEDVPSGAYVTIKTTKQTSAKTYRYYYWQWREGDSWKNEYIGPVKE